MASFSETRTVVRSAVFGALALVIVLVLVFWVTRRDERAAKRAALPACVARLGNEVSCDERFDQYHRECFNYTFDRGGRGRPSSFDQVGYTACIIETPDPWLEKRRAEQASRARESSTRR
jgi:hypothetical protein